MKAERDIVASADLVRRTADELLDMVEQLRDRAVRCGARIRDGWPAGEVETLGGHDILAKAAGLAHQCGYFDAQQAAAYDRESAGDQ